MDLQLHVVISKLLKSKSDRDVLRASSCAPVRVAPQIQEITPALTGCGCGGMAFLCAQGSIRGGNGLRKWKNVRRLISRGPLYSTKSPERSSMDNLPLERPWGPKKRFIRVMYWRKGTV